MRCPFHQLFQLRMLWIVSNAANRMSKNWHLVSFTPVSLTAVRLSIFLYTLAACISSEINRLFISFAHFSIGMLQYWTVSIYQTVNFYGYKYYHFFLLSSINFQVYFPRRLVLNFFVVKSTHIFSFLIISGFPILFKKDSLLVLLNFILLFLLSYASVLTL